MTEGPKSGMERCHIELKLRKPEQKKWILRRGFLRHSSNLANPVCWPIQAEMHLLDAKIGRDIRTGQQNNQPNALTEKSYFSHLPLIDCVILVYNLACASYLPNRRPILVRPSVRNSFSNTAEASFDHQRPLKV